MAIDLWTASLGTQPDVWAPIDMNGHRIGLDTMLARVREVLLDAQPVRRLGGIGDYEQDSHGSASGSLSGSSAK